MCRPARCTCLAGRSRGRGGSGWSGCSRGLRRRCGLTVITAAGRLVLGDHLGGALLPVAALGEADLTAAIVAGQAYVNAAGGLDLLGAVVEVSHEVTPATLGR